MMDGWDFLAIAKVCAVTDCLERYLLLYIRDKLFLSLYLSLSLSQFSRGESLGRAQY
jgi:hypothetical protein